MIVHLSRLFSLFNQTEYYFLVTYFTNIMGEPPNKFSGIPPNKYLMQIVINFMEISNFSSISYNFTQV